ncbi:YegP family protein [Pseudomonas sp. UL073]|uniref:YegP family protein n=1 Tax=Zestomonas insulae TaxID=2809017 RepID=A0ABS2IH97_9GAMM|nr:YegP family protein [Pseudomonas insulae]MBM7062439.1 YegP family protein [Pseudomonas insulae]
MASKFLLKKAKDGQFHFNLHAGNGEIILTSELYQGKDGALNGIESVRKNATREGAFETKEGSGGQPYFVLKATNGQVIGHSEKYANSASCAAGIQSVINNAPGATLVDES